MSSTISKQQLNAIRNEFKEYLRIRNHEWSENTISTTWSDAFFGFNNNMGVDFWASFTSDENLLILRDKIRDYYESEKNSDNAENNANNYLAAMRRFKDFLDEKHPTLAKEWSGKAVSDTNLRVDFQSWMKIQKKSNGEFYKQGTVTAYTNALKNATSKLELDEEVEADLFYYTSVAEFEDACKIILAAPNFEEIDVAAGNKAYSNGIKMYAKFLNELGEPSCWIFQGNPKYNDIVGAIESNDVLTWAVNQYPKQIKKDDRAYIWLSGSEGGVIATGTILCDPEMREPDYDNPINHGKPMKTEPYLAVDIRLERKLTASVVSRKILLADERTKQNGVLTYPGATNYRVTKAQEKVIESIINGTYVRVPAVDAPVAEASDKTRYWLYSPGKQACLWEEFFKQGIMAIGWEELGDLAEYNSKADLGNAMNNFWNDGKNHSNDIFTAWSFFSVMKPGDVVYVKKGISNIIGRGIVEGEYEFIGERQNYKNVRKMNWTHNETQEFPSRLKSFIPTIGDISKYTDIVRQIEEGFNITGENAPSSNVEPYTKEDFLNEVYMSEDRYDLLVNILERKKNIILQGAPGVGKTFAAQRLAFSVMGETDTSRVRIVQFHQSYSYEDFVMGYRPDNTGFKLSEGPFYEFCKMAETDERPHFFIIDEINRGNLSKIFGELLMLIENDKRGEKNAIRLLYSDEQFFVPASVHIIGMMNTADRSLAMIDYALRRRFAFFDMEPAFHSDGFKARQTAIQNPKFDSLIAVVEMLNKAIEADLSLGSGFRIGHSYFCTTDVVDNMWLSSVVEYELIPLLQEYWFDEPSNVDTWTIRLRGAVRG